MQQHLSADTVNRPDGDPSRHAPTRARERVRRAGLAAVSSIGVKIVSAVSAILAVSLTVRYLGVERYGLWATVSSAVALLAFADFGLGNGLLVALSEADGRGDTGAARRQTSTTVVLLIAISGAVLLTFSAAYPFIPWKDILALQSPLAVAEVGPTAAALVLCFALSLPLGVGQKIHMAYQEGLAANVWAAVGAALGLIGLVAAARAGAGLPGLVIATVGAPLLANAAATFVQFRYRRPYLTPRLRNCDRTTARVLGSRGMLFFAMSVVGVIGVSSDNLILAHHLGTPAVAGYSVVQRMCAAINLAAYIAPAFWPAFGEALARQDYAWARRTVRRLVAVCLTATVAVAVPLMLAGKLVVRAWVGDPLVPSTGLLFAFAISLVVQGAAGALSSVLNTGPLLRRQAILYAAACIVSLALKIVFVRSWASAGVVWAGTIGTLVFYVVPGSLAVRGVLRRNTTDA